MVATRRSDLELYRRVLQQGRSYWPYLSALFLLEQLSAPIKLVTPVPLIIVVDSVLGGRPLPWPLNALVPRDQQSDTVLLSLAALLVVAVAVLGQLQGLGTAFMRAYTGEKLVLDFRARLFRHAQRLSLSYHDSNGTADSIYRVQYDAQAVQRIVVDSLISFVTAGFTLGAMLYVTALVDWQLALIALGVSPILFLVSRTAKQRTRAQSREAKTLESSALAVVQEVLTGIRVVKAFGQEDRERERFAQQSTKGMQARLRVALAEGWFGLATGTATAIGTALFLFVGVRHVQEGTLTLGGLLLVMSYLAQLYAPLQAINKQFVSLQNSLASAERVFALLDETPEVVERTNARPLLRAVGAVTFRDVSFGYVAEQPVLREISFEVPPGTWLGIAGTTGAGKTTLVNLLTRFYDPSSGQILLDGVDLRDYRLADLRSQFAIVLQDPVLFSSSIAENIAYANPHATIEEIVAAAEAANAHHFILDLPRGYDTLVGERGMRLSGGERQRISLARAFLRNAPVLILDEPTSSVDVRTEALILEAIERLMRGRTTIMIAHRLSLLASCDQLLRIENGRMVSLAADAAEAV